MWMCCGACLRAESTKTCHTCREVFCSSCFDGAHTGRLRSHVAVAGVDRDVLPPMTELEGKERTEEEVRGHVSRGVHSLLNRSGG